MTTTTAASADATSATARATTFGPLALAGIASIGAGAIHAAAIGVHAEHGSASKVFAALAAAQIAWGALALVARHHLVSAVGVALGASALGGWVMAKTSGISFISGLEKGEEIQFADAAAAALAAVAIMVLMRALMVELSGRSAVRSRPVLLNAVGAVVLLTSGVGMARAGTHQHGEGEGGHDHGTEVAAGDGTGTSSDGHDHGVAAAVPPAEYDPNLPIDLSGVQGVTPEQQARAENLIAITLDRLPAFADPAVAEAAGFFSIGDGFTGHEHYINWNYINDEHILNPDYPESLVYETGPGGSRKLVSAMFMLTQGASLDSVPDLGGALTQWHVHQDLCFTDDPVSPRVAGITSVNGACTPPLKKFDPTPMIHVWITKHPCGPFAALEGVAAGQVAEGEAQLCDHAHGASS